MLTCEGYKMLKGTAVVYPKNEPGRSIPISGTWLYKPDTGYWYCHGQSFHPDIITGFVEDTE